MSVSIENFVKTIYLQSANHHSDTKIGNLAQSIGISSAAVTDMAQKLAKRNLVNYQKYKPLELTKKGEELALTVIRKHRLWESFLHETLGLSLHEIHQEAELLEHQTSEFLANKIEAFLNFPKFDPHGDPIPNKNGIKAKNSENLTTSLQGNYKINRLYSSSKEFFEFCESYDLSVDSEIQLTKVFEESQMVEILNQNQKILLPFSVAQNIYVEPLNSKE